MLFFACIIFWFILRNYFWDCEKKAVLFSAKYLIKKYNCIRFLHVLVHILSRNETVLCKICNRKYDFFARVIFDEYYEYNSADGLKWKFILTRIDPVGGLGIRSAVSGGGGRGRCGRAFHRGLRLLLAQITLLEEHVLTWGRDFRVLLCKKIIAQLIFAKIVRCIFPDSTYIMPVFLNIYIRKLFFH